jgi:hypothetical protein
VSAACASCAAQSIERTVIMKKSIKPLILAALLAATAGVAHAEGDGGDNGMTPHYGDSWANVQAHDPDASTVPSLAAQDDAADARAAWSRARERMHTNMQTMRDRTSNAFHRMTGTSSTGTANSTYGTTGTNGATSGTYGSAGTAGTGNTTSGAYGTSGATGGTAAGSSGTSGSSMGSGTR